MAPALLGYQDVVLDRCWTSEPIYGRAFRGGLDRLGRAGRRILERVALRCDARAVLCLPPYEACLASWRGRRAACEELLQQEAQLRAVWEQYESLAPTALPQLRYDYTQTDVDSPAALSALIGLSGQHGGLHDVDTPTAGRRSGRVLLVGEEVSAHTNYDGLRQYPLCGLGPGGCSRWLAERLADAGISDWDLTWTNALAPGGRQAVDDYVSTAGHAVIALGEAAGQQLAAWGVGCLTVPHPQRWKRFRSDVSRFGEYPLIPRLKELLSHD